MQVAAILTLIQSSIAVAPDAIRLAADFKDFIDALFTAKVVSKDEQDQLHARVTESCLARLRGEIPDYMKVEPDPS